MVVNTGTASIQAMTRKRARVNIWGFYTDFASTFTAAYFI